MSRLLAFTVLVVFLCPLAANGVIHSKTDSYGGQGVSISLQDPIGSVYREDEEVAFSIRTGRSAYVVVFNIDTDGFVHLLYPADGKNFQRFSPDRVYYIPDDPGGAFVVGGPKGLEFVFAVAVEDRDAVNEEEVHFLAQSETLPKDRAFRITGDPFLGANRVMSQLVRGISDRRDVTISFTYYYVGEAVDFPRYLCEDCYEKGKDPYAGGMPDYVANTDFSTTGGLSYPLAEGFVSEYAGNSAPTDPETQTSVTKVYVSYYPRWDDGFYNTAWWYLDPWYWDPWCGPYSGFSFGIGWGWGWAGWGACHYQYFPYYYYGPYYAYRPYWGYYGCYPDYWYDGWYYPPQTESWRSYGVAAKGGGARRSTLHTAMDQRVKGDYGLAQRSVRSAGSSDRRIASARPDDAVRASAQSLRRTGASGGTEPRVIRSRPTRSSKDTGAGLSRDTRSVRSGKSSNREQRVITRSSNSNRSSGNQGTRETVTKGIEKRSGDLGRELRGQRKPETGVTPNTARRGSENRSYAPNVRREGGAKSTPPRSSGMSSGRSSSSQSRATSSSGSRGGSRQRR